MLQSFLPSEISDKKLGELTTLVGNDFRAARDKRTYAWNDRKLSDPKTMALTPSNICEKFSQAIQPDCDVVCEHAAGWIGECWQGRIGEVIGILETKQFAIGVLPEDADEPAQQPVH